MDRDEFRSANSEPRSPGWEAPVRYLRQYPEIEMGARGFPYYVCVSCSGPLQALPRSSPQGVMLVCVYSCGQRYWIDDARE